MHRAGLIDAGSDAPQGNRTGINNTHYQLVIDMDENKRNGEPPIPDNLESLLNEAQLKALRGIRHFGWSLIFVRRPMFQDPVPVVVNADGDKYGVLEKDGKVNVEAGLEMRAEVVEAPKRFGC